MNVIEKRDFIHSYLHFADETIIDEWYETLRHEPLLKAKLEARALKSEKDIIDRKLFSREEVEKNLLISENK